MNAYWCMELSILRGDQRRGMKNSIIHASYLIITFCSCYSFYSILIDVSLRLQGPSSGTGTGRLEVFYNGQWGTICGDSWDINNAKVACRQLGYKYGVQALRGSDVPDGSGQIWLDDVDCTAGSERSLASCYHSPWGVHNCGHNEDAGVECSLTGNSITFSKHSWLNTGVKIS